MSVMVSLLSSWLLLIHVMSVGGVLHRSSGTAELMIASNSAEVRTYWHTMLPNTPMPPAILELLTPPAQQTSNGAWCPSNKVEDNKSNGVWGPSTKANDEKTHQVLWGPSIGNDVLKSNGQWGTSTKSEYPMSNAYTKIEDHNSNGLWGPTTTNKAQKSNAIWGSSTKAEDEKIQFGWVPSRRNKFRKSNGVWGTSTTTDLDKSNGVWGKSTNVEDQNIQFGWDPSTTNDAHKSNGLWGPSIKSKYEKSNGVWGPSTKDGGQESNGVWGPSTKAGDQKNQFGWGPSTEDEDQKSNGVWGPSTKDGDQKSNGVWGPSTKFENQKGNGIWGPSTKYEDQKSNGVWGPSTKVEDQKSNGIWGPSTKDEDRKSNGVWGPSTKSEDQNIQFEWGPSTKAENQKVNFIWGPFTTNDVQKSNGLWGPSTKDEQKKGDRKGDPLQELAGESNIGQGNHKHGTMSNMVFVEEALKVGSTITCYILPSSTTGAPLLQRDVADSIPMSMGNFTDILTMFAPVSNGMATDIWSTLDFCEHPQAIKGETKACATSVESMVEFAGSVLGVSTYNLRAFSSPDVPVEGVMSGRGYKVAAATRITQARDTITCHGMRFPFSMFMCHAVNPTRVYSVTLEGPADAAGADGAVQRMEVLAVCHLDTSEFDPAKMPVHVKPGEAPLCHFVSRDSILWAPAAPTSGHAAA